LILPLNMFRSTLLRLSTLLLVLPFILAQSQCSATQKCPASAPCCSEYGFCGTGSYCHQGCEPLHSNTLTSCRPNPLCQSQSTNFPADLDRLQLNATKYNGNATAYDWVVNAGYVVPTSDGLRLTLNKTNSGSKISSTKYIMYGQIDFTMQTSKWAGVVSAAITMSDVKDEIDWEWPGTATSEAQTNIWFLGIANYTNTLGQKVEMGTNTAEGFHTYTLNWQPDYLQWLIDGRVVRTINRADTLSSSGRYEYPSTPSRIQLSIWPGGIPASAQGTIDWAGGLIQWNEPEYTQNGYYWNTIKAVTVKCGPTANVTAGTRGWAYMGNTSLSVPYVAVTNASTMLSSAMRGVTSPLTLMGAISLVGVVLLGAVSSVL
ncbi:concanavalin A-like lectin/glucanase domain-containing protein, partial [Dioszegia hungarica]